MNVRTFAVAAGMVAAAALPFSAQAPNTTEINAKIRQEGMSHSQIMRTLHYLSDVYGPRLTGSPNHKAAAEWAVKQMTTWGFTNGHLEPWDFGREGWLNEYLAVHVTAPYKDAMVVEALGWTPSTAGKVNAKAFNLVVPEGPEAPPNPNAPAGAGARGGGRGPARLGPTQAELTAYFESIKSKVTGGAVLVGKPIFVPVNLTPANGRITDEQAKCRFDESAASLPECANGRGGFGRGGGGGAAGRGAAPASDRLTTAQVAEQVDRFLFESKAALRINDAGRPHGQIIAFNSRGYDTSKAVPTVVMRNEDYGRIARTLADGTAVDIQAEIVNKSYPEGKTSYNTIAEIAGSDKKDEVVMLGGHLDSWHSATGATDNAIGCAIMMEAARILKTIGVQPRRTIRVALWSGEEEGLLGSLAYVKEHFGSVENPKPEFAKFAGYLNIDTGTGKARGASVFGPPEAGRILRDALAPVKDLGVAGATVTTSRNVGGTDSTSFNNAGLPGIGFAQDSIEYGSHTHHTNLDTYERVIEDDVKASAVAVATLLYQLAMREEMLPRLPTADMPAAPPARTGGH
ncbi:MAG: M20/M25/M40 family metallo-hydrolase [Vicinamibacterales bacterium]